MTDDARVCIVCPARGREKASLVEVPQVCNSCRRWLPALLADIVDMWSRLIDRTVEPDGPWKTRQRYKGHWVTQPGHDPVAALLPTYAAGVRPPGDVVSGSREPAPPVNLDEIDLALPARGDNLTAVGKRWWVDQIGHVSVAMELDLIARAWADHRGARRPVPTVPALTGWLADRAEWACDHYPGIDSDAGQLSRLRGILRGVLGETIALPQHMEAPCPGCDMFLLYRHPGEDKIVCEGDDDCRRVLTADEYTRWSRLVIAAEHDRDNQEPTEENDYA